MSEEQTTTTEQTEAPAAPNKPKGPKTTAPKRAANLSRRTLRALARKSLKERVRTDREFAKTYFGAKSKRSDEKKVAFKKRHAKKA